MGMTLEDVTQYVSVGKAAISAWEIGKNSPSPSDLITVAKLYNVSLDWLFKYEPKTPLLHNVPLVDIESLARWDLSEPLRFVQAEYDYRGGDAGAIQVDFNSPLPDLIIQGDYLIVTRSVQLKVNSPVLILEEGSTVPSLRKYTREGKREFYMADDRRFPTIEASHATIVGQVTEVLRRKMM